MTALLKTVAMMAAPTSTTVVIITDGDKRRQRRQLRFQKFWWYNSQRRYGGNSGISSGSSGIFGGGILFHDNYRKMEKLTQRWRLTSRPTYRYFIIRIDKSVCIYVRTTRGKYLQTPHPFLEGAGKHSQLRTFSMVWTVLLQDVAQLINISWTHILFDHEVFKTKLLLNYKKIMVTFCRISVNPVSKYLKDALSEVSSQATNLHSDINRHQNTSMDFLHSNFPQIYDNVATIEDDVACTTTFSDMQSFFKYWSMFKRGYNSHVPLVDEIINPSNQVVNANSSETLNLDKITNEVPPQDSNDSNKNK